MLGLRFEDAPDARHTSNSRLAPWFSNLLPEGILRQWIAEARGTSPSREMELLAEVGHDLPGAVQVLSGGDRGHEVYPPRLELRAGAEPVGARGLWRFSLAGVAMKFSMREKGGQFSAPAGGGGGDWIVKLPDTSHPFVPQNEHAMMTLASRVGIEVPDVRVVHRDAIQALPDELWPRGEEYAYAVRRFDRGPAGELIHIEDLAQVRNFYPEEKYAGSFETVASLIYRQRDAHALQEFVRRLAFYMLIKNGDAHLKNWSLIYRDRRVPTLSPAYDIVSTAVYQPPREEEDLGLKFCGSRRFATVTLACFRRLERLLGVDLGLIDVARNVALATRAAAGEVGELLDVHPQTARAIQASIAAGAKQLS